jgi:hypothetical protein
MSCRKLGEISNITRRNLESTIISHGRVKFRSWKNINIYKKKEHRSDDLSPVHYVTAAAQVQQHNCKRYGKRKKDSNIELQNSTMHILAYWH